jgi:ABC-2 type transport system ATP-binding protein
MIKVEGLSRAYGSFIAVDDISFECRPGTVTGFLGPNGAGKTTTMRVMVGLTPPTRGDVTIGGLHYKDIPNPGRHVGVLLDASAQHAGRTGREVLEIGARTMGLPSTRIDEMLALVSLDDRESKRRVRNYSLGMRQRLGIAHALLGDPSVLILDEPANGLDPAGIRWMRGLLSGYAEHGGTVLLSSHLLHEVEQIADEMILIGNGKIVASGTREELLRDATGGVATTLVTALDNAQLSTALTEKGLVVHPAGGGLRVTAEPVDVGRVAAERQIVLTDLRAGNEGGLEDLFLELTADTQREGAMQPVPPAAQPSAQPSAQQQPPSSGVPA